MPADDDGLQIASCIVCGPGVPHAEGMSLFPIRIVRNGRLVDAHVCALHVGEHIAEAVHAEINRRRSDEGGGSGKR